MPVLPLVGYEHRPRAYESPCLGIVQHGFGNAVLYGTGGVKIFQLGQDPCLQAVSPFQMHKFQQGGCGR